MKKLFDLQEIDYVDSYIGGSLEHLDAKVSRLERLVQLILSKEYDNEYEIGFERAKFQE